MTRVPPTVQDIGWMSVGLWVGGTWLLSGVTPTETWWDTFQVLLPLCVGWLCVGGGLLLGSLAVMVVVLHTMVACIEGYLGPRPPRGTAVC